ncbi:MAG: DUF1684 domain-containing protein [Candidatus Marinimicrobia bacterium]|nr:DUF1684 domain-containing protein [Candidatus Neomarinimicrobiota bacterium]
MLRFRKDKFFKSNDDSPIPIDQRERFDGLEYYEPNYDLRFILELDELENKEPIEVNDSAGNIRDMLIWGAFHFQVDGTDCTLQAYKSRVGENRLFIPYKDETNEEETYGAGRYIDLYEEKDHTEDGKWILDFNYSTLPWCAYNENYACPYVPPTNWLDAKIKAGEKNYSFEKLS